VLGVCWTGLIMLSDQLLLDDRAWIEENPDTALFAVLHEIGHQWWGTMIGANSNDHPFMVEGLTNAVTIDIVADLYGYEAARRLLYEQIVWPYQAALETSGDGVVDRPVGSESPAGPGRVAMAYGKGALGFLAIRAAIGDDAYFTALAAYADRFLYANAEPADLLALFTEYAPAGIDVAAIWTAWFERAETSNADIEQVVDALLVQLQQGVVA
jgi:aminopeptidase N